jgi:NAD(P)-dependent dehydrogenase (short-subunit alcohol dehydrogenase family)
MPQTLSQTRARGAALVTGAGKRIGRVLALRAARVGFDVAVHHHHSDDDAQAVAAEIRALGRQAQAFAADLSDTAALPSLIGSAAGALGPLTLLVNCASLFEPDHVGAIDPARYDAHQAVNLRAPVLLAQAFAAALPGDSKGLIVNIVDQRVLNPDPEFFSYALSKSGLFYATRTLAQGLAPRIRVNAIGPGPTLASIHQTPKDFEREAAGALLGHAVSPDEIADALAYLIDAPSVTGQMIAVDSGQHLTWIPPA